MNATPEEAAAGLMGVPPPLSEELDPAAAAAQQHLHEQEVAETFATAPAPAANEPVRYESMPAPQRSYLHQPAPPPRAARETVRGPIKVLEELYHRFPMGDGYRVRVWRKEPKKDPWGRLATGIVGDLTEPLSMADFTSCYGGGKYALLVIGPADAARGDMSERLCAEMTLEIPGSPRMVLPNELAEQQEEALMNQPTMYQSGRYPVMPQMGDPEKVQLQKLQIEAEEKKRLEEREREHRDETREYNRQVLEAARPSDTTIEAVRKQGEQALDRMGKQHEQQVNMLRELNDAQHKIIFEKEAELKQLREDVLKAKQEAVTAINNAETGKVVELRERYRDELDQLKETHRKESLDLRTRFDDDSRKANSDYAARLDADSRKYQADLAAATLTAREERARLEEAWQRERAQMREDARQKETDVRQQYEDRLRQQKEQFDERIRDLERNTSRELAASKAQQELAVQTIKESHANAAKVEGTTAEVRIKALENDLAQARSETAKLERENDKLKAEVFKPAAPLLDQVKQITDTARELGMVRAEEVETPEAPAATEGAFDWKNIAAKLAMTALEKAPEAMQKLAEVRAQNAQTAAIQAPAMQARALPPQQQQMAQAPQVPSMAPAGARRRRAGAPPMNMGGAGLPPAPSGPPPLVSQPMYVAPPSVSMPAAQGGYAAPPSVGSPAPMPEPQAPFGTPGYAAPPAGAVWDAPPQQQYAQPEQLDPQQRPQQQAQQTQQVSDSQISMFASDLERAMGTSISPEDYAKSLIAGIGIDNMVKVLTTVNADGIIEKVASLPNGQNSPIVTRSGEKYVHAVWDAAVQILRSQGVTV